ncbi:MAG: YhfC family intramembrane metalloprotease [Ruminococcus sp.]|nr:YhfC family intramembrane metalloprotease [Ruminococcus sp.]
MTDFMSFLAGMIRIITPLILLILWHKKTDARLLPAPAALFICFPVFIIAGALRLGFDHSDFLAFYIQQGIIYGIFEEGVKFLSFRYLLKSYDNRKDAVTYGIGHSAFESIGGGMACLNLIGTGKAAPEIFIVNVWYAVEGAIFVIGLTILVFYGVYSNKSIVMMPAAMFLHALGNAAHGIFIKPVSFVINFILLAGISYSAFRCWKAMQNPYEDEL